MHLSVQQLDVLTRDLAPVRVKRLQGKFSYLEAYDVKATLIRVFGFGGFSSEVVSSMIVATDEKPQANNPERTNNVAICQATVRLTVYCPERCGNDAVYTETAIASNAQPDKAEALDQALKSAESDALKRAAVFLGTQFGLSLYNDGSTAEVVRAIFAPGQQEAFAEAVQIRQAAAAEQAAAAQEQINRATGQESS